MGSPPASEKQQVSQPSSPRSGQEPGTSGHCVEAPPPGARVTSLDAALRGPRTGRLPQLALHEDTADSQAKANLSGDNQHGPRDADLRLQEQQRANGKHVESCTAEDRDSPISSAPSSW